MIRISCDLCGTEPEGAVRVVPVVNNVLLLLCSAECDQVVRRRFAVDDSQDTFFLAQLPIGAEATESFLNCLSFPQRSMLFGALRRSLNGVSMRAAADERDDAT